MTTLVLGATGTVGSFVTRGLVARGENVRILTRKGGKAPGLPAGIEVHAGDLVCPCDLEPAFDGIDRLFLLNALSHSEVTEGLAALEWAKRAKVKSIVYLSVQAAERLPHVAHFAAKTAIEHALRESGISFTILRPNSFFQNDWRLRDAIVDHGVYPLPLGRTGVSCVDVRDIADTAVRCLVDEAAPGETVVVAGPRPWTGPEIASHYGGLLGRKVEYAGDDLDSWERNMLHLLPQWMAFNLRLMYSWFGAHGLEATSDELARLERLLGRPPRRYEDFAEEAVREWTGAGKRTEQGSEPSREVGGAR